MVMVMYHLIFQIRHGLNAENFTSVQHSLAITDDETDHFW